MEGKKPEKMTALEATLIYEDCERLVDGLRKDNGLAPQVAEAYLLSFCAHRLTDMVDGDELKHLMRLEIASSLINHKTKRR